MKKVDVIISSAANYLVFIHAIADVNWHNAYKDKCADLLLPSDRQIIKDNAEYLSFADGNTGVFSEAFFFLPTYLFYQNDRLILEYFKVFAYCDNVGNLTPFLNRFSQAIEMMRTVNPYFMKDFLSMTDPLLYARMRKLGNVFQKYYSTYLENIWYDDLQCVQDAKHKIEATFQNNKVIEDWEWITKYEFLKDRYEVIPVPALDGGPWANTIHYGINTFPAGTTPYFDQYYRFFISHEVGTHLLMPILYHYIQNHEGDHTIPYIAYENLAKYFNMKLLPITMQYNLGEEFYHDSQFQEIYAALEPVMTNDIPGMYEAAIRQFKAISQL